MNISQPFPRIQRMTDEEADAWRDDLFEHIKKQHPHLAVRWWEKKDE